MRLAPIVLLALLAPLAAPSQLDLVAAVNSIRHKGCVNRPAVKSDLRREPRLDRVAQALASGQRLRDAMTGAGYRATRSASLEVSGSEAAVVDALAGQGCKDIADPEFLDVGAFERGDGAWLVLAAPLVPPVAREAKAVGRRVLELVNEARAESRRCGWKRFEKAAPLVHSEVLQAVALAHAHDMAERSSLSHSGHGGSTPADRATRAGYRWRTVGENIASGQATPEQVVAEWVRSPRHCSNLMNADYTEMGVAFAVEPRSKSVIYWSQMLAAPRPAT